MLLRETNYTLVVCRSCLLLWAIVQLLFVVFVVCNIFVHIIKIQQHNKQV